MEKVCKFCGSSSQEEILGPFHQMNKSHFHSNCLAFASNIRKYADKTKSIELALRRGRNRICTFCQQKGATIVCSEKKCKTSFHLSCAIKSEQTLHLHFDKFESYCLDHIPHKCIFDYDPIVGIRTEKSKSQCCQQIYSHDECIKKYVEQGKATSKCPICFNEKIFKESFEAAFDMKISHRRASYARRQSMTYDLQCASDKCVCPRGSLFHKEYSEYELISCEYCGSSAIHKICGKVQNTWICKACDTASEPPSEAYDYSTPVNKTKKRKRKLEILQSNKKLSADKNVSPFGPADKTKNSTPTMPQQFGVEFKIKLPRYKKMLPRIDEDKTPNFQMKLRKTR